MNKKIKNIKSRIITANAGSGKTYTVIEHIKDVINAGYNASSILCITFTKAGKSEMEQRLYDEKILTDDEKPKIATFHALCLEIVSMFTHELGMPLEFQTLEKIPNTTVQVIIEELLNCATVQEYIKKFKVIPTAFERQCEVIIHNYQKLLDTPSRIKAIQDEIFQMDFQDAEEEIENLQKKVLNHIPFDILKFLSGTGIAKAMPVIQEIYSQLNTHNLDKLFKRYTSTIKGIRNGGAFKEYKKQVEEIADDVNNIKTFVQSYIFNVIVDDIVRITTKYKYQKKEFTYNDLIHKALHILNDPELKDFALFKFSHGLKHIIVDEAQDTNQEQWQIIDYIIEELKAENMQGGSLMIVGDSKQTIYGFQGSEEGMMQGIKQKYSFLQQEYLAKSYRTTQPVLDVINAMSNVFNIDEESKHCSAFDKNVGSVNLIAPTDKEENDDKNQEYTNIAEKLASTVQELLHKNLQHAKEKYHGKKITPDDIIILVQNRPNETIINALKDSFYKRHIPISFNEKVNPHYSYAILDFIAILKLCVFSGDRLSLYSVLKSPIFNISEKELQCKFVSDAKEVYINFPFVAEKIRELTATFNNNGIRVLFQALLTQYQNQYSQNERQVLELFIENAPNGYNAIQFLQDFETSKTTLINQKASQGMVKLTTAHSSKGLEYPVVIYLDLKTKDQPNINPIIIHKGTPIFKPSGNIKGKALNEVLQTQKLIEKAELMRLYYVAISRSAEHFYYIGAHKSTEKEDSLYTFLKHGLMQLDAEILHDDNFEYISYRKTINTPTREAIPIQKAIVHYTPKVTESATRTQEMQYGVFIHKLFENISNESKLQEHMYAEFLNETLDFQKELNKVKRFNNEIAHILQPISIKREQDFVYNNEIIRIDAIYFLTNTIAIIDYKTQKQGVTESIKMQLLQYKKAIEQLYNRKTQCFIAWYGSEILEEI